MSHLFRCLLVLGLALALPLRAQDPLSDAPLNPSQVDQLLGPIALYPDALIALILPASTTPGDIVLAQRYLAAGGAPGQVDSQPWNESVRALARYPMLIKWLDENLSWTQQLGQTFLSQPDEVMNAVQRLRARAKASGALTSTAQQKLVLDGDVIEIVPAQPSVIYVPYYDPNVVYGGVPGYYYNGPYLTFGLGMPIGLWLSYDFNWHQRTLWVGDRHHNWSEPDQGDWSHRYGEPGHSNGNWRRWQPPANRPPYVRPPGHSHRPDYYRPSPFPGSPSHPPRDARPQGGNPPRPDASDHRDGRDHRDFRPAPVPVAPPSSPRHETSDPRGSYPTATPVPAPNYPRPDGSGHRDRVERRPAPVPTSASTTSRPEWSPGSPAPLPPAPVSPPRTDRGNPPAQPRPDFHGPSTGAVPPALNPSHSRQFNPPPPPPVHVAPPPPGKDGSRDRDPQGAR